MNNIKFSSFSTFRLAAALGFLFLLAAMNPGPGLLQPLLAQGCSGIPTSECQALYALYQSTDGDNWSRNDNWKSPAPTAQWYGVTVSNGHVTGLSLDENLLYGEIPWQIGNLTQLEVLDFSGNYLRGEIPAEIGGLSQLYILSFWDNNLWGEIPPGIWSLDNLGWLDLSVNYLSGGISSDIANLTWLEYLYLEDNLLTGTLPSAVTGLSGLKVLSVSDNQLSGTIPSGIGSLASLQRLLLSDNYFSGAIPSGIGSLASLQYLRAGNNRLTGNIPSSIYTLPNLLYLSLGNNLLSGEIGSGINSLTKLQQLDLSGNQLTGGIPASIGSIGTLRSLYLNGNRLTGSIPGELGSIWNLQELALHENQLSGVLPTALAGAQNLYYLSLYSNQLQGSLPAWLGSMYSLDTLYLSDNNFSGQIPANLGYSNYLYFLGLSGNQLEGAIPATFANLSYLRGLWASGNLLSGELPGFLTVPPESLDLRWNQLTSSNNNILAPVEAGHGNRFLNTQTLAPVNLSARAGGPTENENRIDLSWDPIVYTENDGGYEIFFRKSGDAEFTRAGMTAGKTMNSYTLPDLKPDTGYEFQVRTVTRAHAGNRNLSSSASAQTGIVTTGNVSRAFIPVWKRGSDKFTGIVVSNFSDTPFNASLTAYDETGSPEVPPAQHANPSLHQVQANHQLSLLGTEFFWPGNAYHSNLSWVEVAAENTNRMGSMFLFGVTDTAMLDGAESQTRYAKKLYFTRPLEEGLLAGFNPDIQLSVVNPFEESLSVTFTLAGENGSLASGPHEIPAKGFITTTCEELFGSGHGIANAFMAVETADGPGIVGFARTEIPGIRTALGLNAIEPGPECLLYSAQMADGVNIVTNIRLINTSPETRQLRFRAIAPDGAMIGSEIPYELCSQCVVERDFGELFSLSGSGIIVGSLEVEASGGGVIGDVIFADGENLEYAMSMPLQTKLFEEAVFNHVAHLPVIFTGIALYNPGDTTADINISVFDLDGQVAAVKSLQLPAGSRISRTMIDADMWPALPYQSGGYIKVQSSRPIVGQQLFGDVALRYMAAIPPTTRLEPMFD